jgi:Holliday junction resolvase-like predicted endonuclease
VTGRLARWCYSLKVLPGDSGEIHPERRALRAERRRRPEPAARCPAGTPQQLGVRVDGRLSPVKQAFELATRVRRSSFTSHTAQRHLAALGFELVDERDSAVVTRQRDLRADRGGPASPQAISSGTPRHVSGGEWHTEARVQSAIISYLARTGWQITSAADTARREHGIDIVAIRQGHALAIEVKGFPSRYYADPSRADEQKKTQPSTQAKHWYAQAVLAAMLTRSRRPRDQAVIALPDFPRYRKLYSESAGSLQQCAIELWWVSENGAVRKA